MDFGAVLLGLLTVGVVKIAVMVLGGRLVLRHARARRGPSHRRFLRRVALPQGAEFRLLWWSLVLFCVSELVCGVEIYILAQAHVVPTSLHAVASSVGMGLFALAMLLYLDRRLLWFQGDRCLGHRVCNGCTVHAESGCKLHGFVLLCAVFVAFAALLPFCVSTASVPALPEPYTLPFAPLNAWYDQSVVPWLTANFPSYQRTGVAFVLPEWMFVLEYRLIPSLALLGAVAAVVLIARRDDVLGVRVLVFAAGVLAYTYLEILVYRGTGEALLGSLIHELAEFWFLLAVGEWLHRIVPGELVRAERADTSGVSA